LFVHWFNLSTVCCDTFLFIQTKFCCVLVWGLLRKRVIVQTFPTKSPIPYLSYIDLSYWTKSFLFSFVQRLHCIFCRLSVSLGCLTLSEILFFFNLSNLIEWLILAYFFFLVRFTRLKKLKELLIYRLSYKSFILVSVG
jgi:hypothetical protein